MKTFLPSGVFVLLAALLGSAPASAQTVSIVSGNGQLICGQCPTRTFIFDPLVVVVRDARGNPMPNATVNWSVNNPPGSDGRLSSSATVTGADGTTSNDLFLSAPIMLLQTFLQTRVSASAFGSSVSFIETNGAVGSGTGLALIVSSLQSPMPGTLLAGAPGSVLATPVRINVASLSAGGAVPGVEVRIVSDPDYPATAACVGGSVLTDANGNAVCNLQFGPATGAGKIRIFVGGGYDAYGPFALQVSGTPVQTPPPPPPAGQPSPPPPGPSASSLTASPAVVNFQYPGAVTQNVAVIASSGSVAYTAAVQVTIARVDWFTVGTPSGPASTDGRSSFPVTVLPQSLSPGTYRGTIVVHPSAGGQDVIVNVQLDVQTGGTGTPPPPTQPPPTTPGGPAVSISAAPTLLTFQYPGPVTQNVAVIASGGIAAYTPSVVVTIARVDWLTVGAPNGPAYADARSTFPVNVLPQNLAPGTYRGTISIHPAGGSQDVLVNVQLIVSQAVVSLSTTSLRFSQVAGRGPFSGGTIAITSSAGSVPFTASVSGPGWLAVSPASGATPAQLAVAVNPSGLAPGSYDAAINISAPGAANSLLTVNVNLAVAPSQSLRLSAASLTFTSEAGGPAPAPQTLAAAASDGTLQFSAAAAVASPLGGSWLQVTPSSGATGGAPANIVVSVNPAGLDPGAYTGLITLTSPAADNSPQAVAVTYVITPLATPVPTLISSAASGLPGAIAPGEIVTIRGRNLGPAEGIQTNFPGGLAHMLLSETQVTFDNIVAPLLYVSAGQINAIVPYGVAGRVSTRMVVSYKRASSAAVSLSVADAAPALFVLDDRGQGAIVNEDGSINGPSAPASRGRVVVMFGTGEGVTNPFGVDGMVIPPDPAQLKHPLLPVSVAIGGVPAEVQYAGSAPGMVSGAIQLNVVVPDGAPTGSGVPVVVTVGAFQSQGTALMAIQ